MANFSFIGGGYLGQSATIDAERCVNMVPQVIDGGGHGKGGTKLVLVGSPGLQRLGTLTDYPVRSLTPGANRLFGVSGGTVYELFNDGTANILGNVNIDNNPAQMFLNGTQIFIVSGGTGYIADGLTVTPVVTASTGCFINGYFVAAQPNSREFLLSAINDGTSWDPLDKGRKDGAPDAISAVYSAFNQLWIFGFETTEVWMNTGNADFPFQLVAGGLLQIGLYAPWSVATIDPTTIAWLGGNAQGHGVVYAATGINQTRISNHALEWKIQNEYGDIRDASAFAYQDTGHYYYVLNFPSAKATWVWDKTSGYWHERAYLEPNGSYSASLARCHAFVFDKHVVGSYRDGRIFEQRSTFYTDDGNPIRRLRSSPHITDEMKIMTYPYLQLDMQTGEAPLVGQGVDPMMMMRISDDGGRTWGNEQWASAGPLGNRTRRVIWRRGGQSQDRAYEISSTEPIEQIWVNAYVDVHPGAGR